MWKLFIYAFCCVTLMPSLAYAYLDAATGTIIIQGLLAAAAGLVMFIRLYWRRIKKFFTKREALPSTTDSVANQENPPPDSESDAG